MRRTIFGVTLVVAGYGMAIWGVYNLLRDEVNRKLEGIKDRVTTLEIGYATLRTGGIDDLK